MLKLKDKTFGLISHPFWTDLLEITQNVSQDPVFLTSRKSNSVKAKLLQLILNGFYPLGNISCPVFKQIEISSNGEAADIVRPIYEADAGLRPLIKGTKYASMTHPEQFKAFIESLQEGVKLSFSTELKEQLLTDTKIKTAGLSESIACGYAIENAGPGIICAMQDLAAKWQVYNNRSSKFIEYNFVYEHGLIEGSESEDQHVFMIEALFKKFEDRISHDCFNQAGENFVKSYHKVLDKIMFEVAELLDD